MSRQADCILCSGLDYECKIGFHDYEKLSLQRITLDLIAYLPQLNYDLDKVTDVTFDYYLANQMIKQYLKDKEYNIIEALAEDIAYMLLKEFSIHEIKVRVTKYPLDMPNLKSVSFECVRARS
jgi:dihydroneopterin aldolase